MPNEYRRSDHQLRLVVSEVNNQFHDADQPGGGHMLVQLPQDLIVNEPLAKFNNVQVTVFQFPHLPVLQWMRSLFLFHFHIYESDTRGGVLLLESRLHFCKVHEITNWRGICSMNGGLSELFTPPFRDSFVCA